LNRSKLANPAGVLGSRRTAARFTVGTISFSISNHFALLPYSNAVKPVVLPLWLRALM
jgi:hypothetical protein